MAGTPNATLTALLNGQIDLDTDTLRVALYDDSTAFTFDFGSAGTIVTPRVSNISQGDTLSFDIILTPDQTELWETLTAASAGAVVRAVPDGETFTEDTTPSDRQTVSITPPSSAADSAIEQGDYVVMGWESRGSDGGAYRLSVEIDSRY